MSGVNAVSSPNDFYGAWGPSLAYVMNNMKVTAQIIAGTYDHIEEHQARADATSWEKNLQRVDVTA